MQRNSGTVSQGREYSGRETWEEPTPVIITFSISESSSPFESVNLPKAPYIDVIGSVACTKRGAISSPLPEVMSKPPIFVVLPPMSIPTTIFLLICFAFLFGEFGGETTDATACRKTAKARLNEYYVLKPICANVNGAVLGLYVMTRKRSIRAYGIYGVKK